MRSAYDSGCYMGVKVCGYDIGAAGWWFGGETRVHGNFLWVCLKRVHQNPPCLSSFSLLMATLWIYSIFRHIHKSHSTRQGAYRIGVFPGAASLVCLSASVHECFPMVFGTPKTMSLVYHSKSTMFGMIKWGPPFAELDMCMAVLQ
jgi:hypothetical protein